MQISNRVSKLISISLSPNVFEQDINEAKVLLKKPLLWLQGEHISQFQSALARYFQIADHTQLFLFNSGRSALFSLLQAFGIGQEDEVLLQAFTCNAVPNPVLWLGAKPVYVDVNEDTFNMDIVDLEKKIRAKSRVIIVQHTFGLAADLDSLLAIAKKHKLIVIEDCAHALGARHRGKLLGTFGDAAFFSFGRDKVISCVYGGAAIINQRPTTNNLQQLYEKMSYPSQSWVKQQLRHPIIMDKLLRWYNTPIRNYGVGKFLLQFSQTTRFLSKAVDWKEKQGMKPDYFPARLPNALAGLALLQFQRLDKFNAHRRKLAAFYYHGLKPLTPNPYTLYPIQHDHIYLRYPVRHPQAHRIITRARNQGILLGDWYNWPIAPDDTNLEKMQYHQGSCPVAERLTRETLNLPTNPNLSLQDAEHVVKFLEAGN